jgi:hypothetical protein
MLNTRTTPLLTMLLGMLAAGAPALADSFVFSETNFDPGTWSAGSAHWMFSPDDGEQFSATSDRFQAGNPTNKFMITQFMIDVPGGAFNVALAPVFMTGWTHDPGTQGAIDTIAASVRTLPVSSIDTGNFGGPRLFIYQDGQSYVSTASGPWVGFTFDEPETVRNFSGYTATEFVEVTPNTGLDLNSHPDFAGAPMEFAFGMQLTSTGLSGVGETTRAVGWDDLSVRIQTVPEPASLMLLALSGAVLLRRRS